MIHTGHRSHGLSHHGFGISKDLFTRNINEFIMWLINVVNILLMVDNMIIIWLLYGYYTVNNGGY